MPVGPNCIACQARKSNKMRMKKKSRITLIGSNRKTEQAFKKARKQMM